MSKGGALPHVEIDEFNDRYVTSATYSTYNQTDLARIYQIQRARAMANHQQHISLNDMRAQQNMSMTDAHLGLLRAAIGSSSLPVITPQPPPVQLTGELFRPASKPRSLWLGPLLVKLIPWVCYALIAAGVVVLFL